MPDTMMLDGIDGLLAYEGDLIAIQGGSLPPRIVRLKLSPDGTTVRNLEVLERAHPAWSELTLGTISGDRLIYVADAQWERFGGGGVLSGDQPLRPTGIRSLKLD